MSNTKLSPFPSWTNSEVFIWPGRMNGAVPMKMIRISLGWISSVRGNQFEALFIHGDGLIPSKSSPSCQRPLLLIHWYLSVRRGPD